MHYKFNAFLYSSMIFQKLFISKIFETIHLLHLYWKFQRLFIILTNDY